MYIAIQRAAQPSADMTPLKCVHKVFSMKLNYSLSANIGSQELVRRYHGDLSFSSFFLRFSWASFGFPSFSTLAVLVSYRFPDFGAPGDLMARPYGKTPTVHGESRPHPRLAQPTKETIDLLYARPLIVAKFLDFFPKFSGGKN